MDYGHAEADRKLKELETRIRTEYGKAVKEAEKKANAYLIRFREKDAIMADRLKAGDITHREYMQWRTQAMMTTERWNTIRSDLADVYANAGKVAEGMITDNAYDVYALNFNFGTYEAERGSGVDTAFTLYSKDTVRRLVKDDPTLLPPPGKKTSEAIARGELQRWNKRQIQSVMMQSILQGESIPKIAKRLADTVGERNMKSAIRDARTMTTSAQNAGRLDSYYRAKEMGIEMQKEWMATHDSRTRHSHRDIDGQVVPVDQEFGNGLMFPADPDGPPEEVYNCRCTLVAKVMSVDGIDISDIPDQTTEDFEEWMEAHYE